MNTSLTLLDLFSGIGGFSYAAEQLVGGFSTIAFCEPNQPCQDVLRKHWPSTPIFPDVRTLTAQDILPLCPNGLSLITAGFPCQDLSVAGKQAGYNGERSVLFYEIIRLARELRPQFLLLENVRNLLSHQNGETFQETLFQIAQAGYDAEWAVISASDLGACHRRERIWIIAYPTSRLSQPWQVRHSEQSSQGCRSDMHLVQSGNPHCTSLLTSYTHNTRLERRQSTGVCECEEQWPTWSGDSPTNILSTDWRSYVSKPVLRRGDDGLSNRMDRLKQLGNSIVPQVAAIPLQRIKQLAELNNNQLLQFLTNEQS
jgi:DNA (cytosine-5)-methyltransferase 1